MADDNKKQAAPKTNGGSPSTGECVLGIVGGTGIYGVEAMDASTVEELEVWTPYGATSSKIRCGTVAGLRVAFVARHDVNHRHLPSEIPFRANIWALKSLGVRYLLSVSAVGSLREEMKPLDIVLADQFIDHTRLRRETFFGDGVIAHTSAAEPVCAEFRARVAGAIGRVALDTESTRVHNGGTYVCIEGPAFSSKAESNMYRRAYEAHVIGMTMCPEVKLALEAEMAYAIVAMVTDYDCWHADHDSVTVEQVVATLKKNGENAQKIVTQVIKELAAEQFASKHHDALKFAVLTPKDKMPPQRVAELRPILKKYL